MGECVAPDELSCNQQLATFRGKEEARPPPAPGVGGAASWEPPSLPQLSACWVFPGLSDMGPNWTTLC